jgi:AcrR family transcriptional regulator
MVDRGSLRSPAPALGAPFAETLLDLALDCGIDRLSAARVAELTGMQEAEFERRFGSLENCYLELFEEVWSSFEAAIMSAYESRSEWRDQMRAAAYAAARWLRDHPRQVRFAAIEMLTAGPMAQAVRERHLEGMVDLIDRGRRCLPDSNAVGREVAIMVMGAVQGLLLKELRQGRGTADAEAAVPQLMYMAVRPYLGEDAAREEIGMPPPAELPLET